MEKAVLKPVRGYVDDDTYEQLREVAYLLNMSMSKVIVTCLIQGMEVMRAEAMGQEPKVLSKTVKEYVKKKNDLKSENK